MAPLIRVTAKKRLTPLQQIRFERRLDLSVDFGIPDSSRMTGDSGDDGYEGDMDSAMDGDDDMGYVESDYEIQDESVDAEDQQMIGEDGDDSDGSKSSDDSDDDEEEEPSEHSEPLEPMIPLIPADVEIADLDVEGVESYVWEALHAFVLAAGGIFPLMDFYSQYPALTLHPPTQPQDVEDIPDDESVQEVVYISDDEYDVEMVDVSDEEDDVMEIVVVPDDDDEIIDVSDDETEVVETSDDC